MEIAAVVGVAILLFGADKLPKLAKSAGQAKKEFMIGQAEADIAAEKAPRGSPQARRGRTRDRGRRHRRRARAAGRRRDPPRPHRRTRADAGFPRACWRRVRPPRGQTMRSGIRKRCRSRSTCGSSASG